LGLTQEFLSPYLMEWLPEDRSDPIWSISLWESRFYMSNMLLRDSDNNGMAHSLEIRVPFLDRRLIDYVYSLPGNVRMPTPQAYKYLLRKSFPDLLRPQITKRAKTGFTLPIGQWMAGPLREICEEAIAHLKIHGLLRPEGVDQIWNDFIYKKQAHWSRAFTLCVLGQYLRSHKLG
jgi:asparagine synthase (glutamine-hydrolysing)